MAIAENKLSLSVTDQAKQDEMIKVVMNEVAADTPTDNIKRLLRYMQQIHNCKRKDGEEPEIFARRFQGIASQYLVSCNRKHGKQDDQLFAMVLLENAGLPDYTLDNIVLQLIASAKERSMVQDNVSVRISAQQLIDNNGDIKDALSQFKNDHREVAEHEVIERVEKMCRWLDECANSAIDVSRMEDSKSQIYLADAVAAISKVRGKATKEDSTAPITGSLMMSNMHSSNHHAKGTKDRQKRKYSNRSHDASNKCKRTGEYIPTGTGKKMRSQCHSCGLFDHWYRDPSCPNNGKESVGENSKKDGDNENNTPEFTGFFHQ